MKRTLQSSLTGMAALLTSAALALTGCASTDAEPEARAESSETSELTGTLTVFAAASLSSAFETLAADFVEENPGVSFASITFDGSSTLATQLTEGATADVFAAADDPNMEVVNEAGLLASDPVLFASNRLVIAVAPGNPLSIESLADLAEPIEDGNVPITVMCAPEVPCGAAATRLLDAAGVALNPASEEQNATATLTKVRMGEADAGIVYLSDVMGSAGEADGIEIDGALEDANRYPIARLAGSESSEAADAFIDFVLSESGLALLRELGFGAP